MTWFIYALSAAVLWGLAYILIEQLLKTVSVAGTMLFSVLGSAIIYLFFTLTGKTLSADIKTLFSGGKETTYLTIVILTLSIGNMLILKSIKDKNATIANLIEVSYPLFTALFAWMIFKEQQLTIGTALGAVLIFSGIACIAWFGRTV